MESAGSIDGGKPAGLVMPNTAVTGGCHGPWSFPFLASRLFALFFLGCAALYALTTLCAIVNFSWRQPMFDQWRMYETFLGLPFPQNVLQLENGHRPIIPNLFRVAETRWLGGNQLLQISIGTICAFLTWLAIAATAWNARKLPLIARAIGVMLATLGLFWLANARILLHGNESLHVYLLTLAVVGAALCTFEAKRRDSLGWLCAGTGASAIAMFCFGPGVASFPAIVLLGLVLRLPWRWLLLPIGVLAGCLLIYLLALPGSQGVREMVGLRPVDSMLTIARWLSSPWINGWLGFSEPPLAPWMAEQNGTAVLWLRASANRVVAFTGHDWREMSTVIGLAGIFGFGIRCAIAGARRDCPDRLEALLLGLGLFALATAAVIGIGRVDYLQQYPSETYSDRYLVWPSLFWMSLLMLLMHDAAVLPGRGARTVAYVFCATLPAVLLATHSLGAGWGATVYRIAQQTSAQLRSGIYDEAHFPAESRGAEIEQREIDLLRTQRIAMFAEPAWQRLDTHWSGTLETADDTAIEVHWLPPIDTPDANRPAAHIEGWVTRGIGTVRQRGQLVVLSEDRIVAGFAEYSFVRPNARSLLLDVPSKRGFDGYIRNYDNKTKYTLAVADFGANRAFSLTSLPAPSSATNP